MLVAVAALVGALTGTQLVGSAAPFTPSVGWTPANTGVMWWYPGAPQVPPQQPPGSVTPLGAFWLTRRMAVSPFTPGLMFMGSFLHGLYTSAGGAGWATTTPRCWLPPVAPTVNGTPLPAPVASAYLTARNAVPSPGELDVCGVEGIAFDPTLPNRLYVTAYSIALSGSPPVNPGNLGNGGVYVSDDLGRTWKKLLGGIRGNGLSVQRTAAQFPAEIVAGYIQENNTAVGSTPADNSGGLLNGQPSSLAISVNDGATWNYRALPATTCGLETVGNSPRLTPSVAINPALPAHIFAGTNAGLFMSADYGNSWSLVQQTCGGVWGLAFSKDGSQLFVGDRTGVVKRATGINQLQPLGGGLSTVATLPGGTAIQTLLIDPRDATPSYLYAARWNPAANTSTVNAAVWRIRLSNGTSFQMLDSSLTTIEGSWPTQVPKPFPLTYQSSPSLFLAQTGLGPPAPQLPEALYVSTIFRGVFVRSD